MCIPEAATATALLLEFTYYLINDVDMQNDLKARTHQFLEPWLLDMFTKK